MIDLAADPMPVVLPNGYVNGRQSEEGKEAVMRVIYANEWRLRRIEETMARSHPAIM